MLEEGKTYCVKYPFCLDVFNPDMGEFEFATWRPGTNRFATEFTEWAEADAMGEMILTIVSIHRPGDYPTRVFFTRQWKDPDGKIFGKQKLQIKTKSAFKRMLKGYRYNYTIKGG